MKNKPNPELIDNENLEWTEAMLSEAKTAAELFPHLIKDSKGQTEADSIKVSTTIDYVPILFPPSALKAVIGKNV